ncbi:MULTISPECIES: hypothetical protein [unclassified Butyrivibrio]|uniref:hypothetical protein n=1 Tax=unclassified Butyrivibrio TaxID=2639466 RepID=UPI0003B45FFD|nr:MULTISPECIES: hypothetical protein [unclassified Butyrivibrio]MDC7292367.1 hypothetical protein [Butyrivibrio sp. DSM 10294]
MKKWNTPELAELNLTETAGGFWCDDHESCTWYGGTHDHTPKGDKGQEEKGTESTPEEEEFTDKLS